MRTKERPLGLIFVGLNVSLVGLYCLALSGKVEPLKFHPTRFVTLPLMVSTAVVSIFLYPLMRRLSLRLARALTLYFGFALIAMLYGIYLWILFPDGSPWTVLVALIGAHLYGLPLFLAVLVTNLLAGRLLLPETTGSSLRSNLSGLDRTEVWPLAPDTTTTESESGRTPRLTRSE